MAKISTNPLRKPSLKKTRTFSRSTPRLSKAAEQLAIQKKRKKNIRDFICFGLLLSILVYALWQWWFLS